MIGQLGITFGDVDATETQADEIVELKVKVPQRAAAALLQQAEEAMNGALVECSLVVPASAVETLEATALAERDHAAGHVSVAQLRAARALLGLSIEQLADALGLHPDDLADAESKALDTTLFWPGMRQSFEALGLRLIGTSGLLSQPTPALSDEDLHGLSDRAKETIRRLAISRRDQLAAISDEEILGLEGVGSRTLTELRQWSGG